MGRVVVDVKDFCFKYRRRSIKALKNVVFQDGGRQLFLYHRLQRIR